jgi:FtsH-binding integral membrane protein
MRRELALKVILIVVGLLFVATIYPLITQTREPALQMMLSLYVTLGIFLLLASRNPAAHRSLIAFTAWSSFAHASVMAVQEYFHTIQRQELFGVAVFGIIGATLLALAPAKQAMQRASAAGA